jgi:phenylalanyl-tRNA synthetase alpha chain
MDEELRAIRQEALAALGQAGDLKALEALRVTLLGKKGSVTQLLKTMGALPPAERPAAGQQVNDLRQFIEHSLDQARKGLQAAALAETLKAEALDITMPGTTFPLGNKHPMTKVIDDVKQLFMGMGYEIAEGPDVETDYYNFEALNIPAGHPAKDEQDTFYVEGGFLLRTQTSPVQVRTMEKGRLPIRIISPGRVFRSDAVDATHSPVFHQLEGLVVDVGITMGDLKGSLAVIAQELLGPETRVRFRPHHFPFTEPSAEMDASCFACGGKGCRVCKDSGWIEMLGCGMVHPKVLSRSGIDPEKYTGFAFGMGLERVALQRYAISDLRLLYENDVEFLKQF